MGRVDNVLSLSTRISSLFMAHTSTKANPHLSISVKGGEEPVKEEEEEESDQQEEEDGCVSLA